MSLKAVSLLLLRKYSCIEWTPSRREMRLIGSVEWKLLQSTSSFLLLLSVGGITTSTNLQNAIVNTQTARQFLKRKKSLALRCVARWQSCHVPGWVIYASMLPWHTPVIELNIAHAHHALWIAGTSSIHTALHNNTDFCRVLLQLFSAHRKKVCHWAVVCDDMLNAH